MSLFERLSCNNPKERGRPRFAAPQVYRGQVAELARLYREGHPLQTIQTRVFEGNGSGTSTSRVFQSIDGIKFLLHAGGCGGTREDANNLCGLIAGYITIPTLPEQPFSASDASMLKPEFFVRRSRSATQTLTSPW